MQRGLVDYRAMDDGGAVAPVGEAHAVEPDAPSRVQVPLDADFVQAGAVTMAGRYLAHGAPPPLPAWLGLSRWCGPSLFSKGRRRCDEGASPCVVVYVVNLFERPRCRNTSGRSHAKSPLAQRSQKAMTRRGSAVAGPGQQVEL